MTATETEAPDVASVKHRLEEVGQLIEATSDDLRQLYDERLAIFVALRAAGVSRDEMAALAGVSPGMVKFALGAGGRKESPPE